MTDSTTEPVSVLLDNLSNQLNGLGAAIGGLIARYDHAREAHDLHEKLRGFCTYLETKYRAEEGGGRLHRPESFYAFAEGCYEDTPFRIEVDGPTESVVLHGILREIEGGCKNVNDTGYCYLSF